MSHEPVLVELENVSKRYESGEEGEAPYVLKDVMLKVSAGRSVAITGPSGSGKSTLLNIIGTLDRPTSGRVLLEGRDLGELEDDALAEVRNRRIGFVFQLHHLLPQCTVLENVLVPTLVGDGAKGGSGVEQRARELLERVGLTRLLSRRPGQLSGGERQRVAVVRALINQPPLLLADEPTGSLDHAAADNLMQLLGELNREENVALVVATHAMDLAERMDRFGVDVKLPWGNAAEKARAERLAQGLKNAEVLPRLNLAGVARVLAGAKACVAVDTGLGHLAAALDVPTISLFGPTNPGLTGAYGKAQIHLASDFPCAPCLQKKCTYQPTAEDQRRFDLKREWPLCFTRLNPERVATRLSTLLLAEEH